MATPSDALEMRFTANMRDLERELSRLQRINNKATQKLAQDHARAAQQSQQAWSKLDITRALQQQLGGLGAVVRQYAGILAGAFAGREALAAAETWTKFTNSLKVAGLEGSNLKTVQDALYASAIKNGVAIEPLGQLYNRLSQSQAQLGASQAQLIQFTNGVTAALRVQGGDASEAAGALMQMSQALAGGTVRAEEYNSINEGALPILQAVAEGWKKQGTSVSDLRAIMLAGKLSSKEFFESFLRGSEMLEQKAAKAPLTVGASMVVLHTALTKYIGETDQSLGVTQRISQALIWLSENIDSVRQALMIVGGVWAATFIPTLARASAGIAVNVAASISSTAAMAANTAGAFANATALGRLGMMATGAAAASRGLAAALAFFGGPIGIAITAIGAALAYLAVSSAQAAAETQALDARIAAINAKLGNSKEAALAHNAATGQLSGAQRAAAVQTAALTGEVHKLKDAYYLAAAAAKTLAVANAWKEHRASVNENLKPAEQAYNARVESERRKFRTSRSGPRSGEFRGMPVGDIAISPADDLRLRNRVLNSTPEGKRFRESVDATKGLQTEAERIEKAPLKTFGAPVAPAAPSSGKGGGKGGGKSTKDIGDASQAAIDAAEKEYHNALHASAQTAEQRHQYALEQLEEDKAEKLARIDRQAKNKDITEAAAQTAKGLIEQAYQQDVLNENYRRQVEVAEQQAQVSQANLDLDIEALRQDGDALDATAQNTRNLRDRYKYERLALAKKQQADDLAFKAAQDQLELDREKAGWTKEEIKALRAKAEANRETEKRNQNGELDKRQSRDQPRSVKGGIVDYAEGFGSLNEQLTNIATNGLDSVTRGLTDAIMGAKSLKEAFSDMAKSIIANLIEMAVRFVIFEAIGMAFGVKGLGKAAIGIGKNAKGTNNWTGGLTMVGEKGPELAYLPGGTKIMPNNVLNAAMAQTPSLTGSGAAPVVNISTTVNANDAVLTSWVKSQIDQGNVRAVQAAQKLTMDNIAHRNRNALGR